MISGGSGGRRRRAPPYGSTFFRFDIQIFRNVAASGVGVPPTRSAPPPREILDPLLMMVDLNLDYIKVKCEYEGHWIKVNVIQWKILLGQQFNPFLFV